ncbi:MAG: hypothetical protein ACR2O3_05340 [Rhizobiaceae bacterium]
MGDIFKKFLAVLALTLLAACQSSEELKFKESGFHITSVDVTLPNQTETHKTLQYSEGFGSMIKNTLHHYASEYNATRPNATQAYTLEVNLEKVHFKNAVQSLLIGDANHVQGTAKLVDRETGEVAHTMPAKYIDAASGALNGISGAVLSVVVKKEAAESTLSKGLAGKIMQLSYPDVELPNSAKRRLKDKTVHQPVTTAISPLSKGIETQPSDEVNIAAATES